MKNKVDLSAGVVAIAVFTVSGCAFDDTDYQTSMCQKHEIRVEYSECENSVYDAQVVYISTNSSYSAPPIGGKISQSEVQKTLPPRAVLQKNAVPATGGKISSISGIQRGGFGIKGGSSSGS